MGKKHSPTGTPALIALEAGGVSYRVHEYEHDPRSDVGFGLESAAKLGVEAQRVFKTLMAEVDGRLVCAVVPASGQLDLKALAAALGAKRAEMAKPLAAERATGYVVGGISPMGQKTPHTTVIDDSSLQFATIIVSGGRRGLSIELAPSDLTRLTNGVVAAIGRR